MEEGHDMDIREMVPHLLAENSQQGTVYEEVGIVVVTNLMKNLLLCLMSQGSHIASQDVAETGNE